MRVRVGFSRGTTWVARLICWITHTDISHSFFLVEDGGEEWVYEATPRGFRRTPWSCYVVGNRVRTLVEMDWPHPQVKHMLDGMLGTRYALATFFWLGAMLMLRRTARRPRLFARYGIDCVSSVSRVMAQFGVGLVEPITPAELKDWIERKR